MHNLLVQLDSSRLPSVFDQVVAYDGGADRIMSYGGVTPEDVRDLIHGCIFTRGEKYLRHTAVWIGGNNMSQGEQLLAMAVDAMVPPLTVSVMLDSNGSNTTAVAAVVKIEQAVGSLKDRKVVVLAGTGPVGQRAAGLLARDGAKVTITSRKPEQGEKARQFISARFNVQVESTTMSDPTKARKCSTVSRSCSTPGPRACRWSPRQPGWRRSRSRSRWT
jgi:threonine dehydrogenase-like Zn-dependent dehydrogenase